MPLKALWPALRSIPDLFLSILHKLLPSDHTPRHWALEVTFIMIWAAFGLLILASTGASGQSCKTPSGRSGYCREKGDCLGDAQQSDCPTGLACCRSSDRSAQKCKEYGRYVFREAFNGALTARILVHNASECSVEAVPLIVGGVKAKAKEFPHMVAIGYGESLKEATWMCGGSLISESYVLTAAHCCQSEARGPAKFARMGTSNLKRPEAEAQDITIAERISHPKYKPPSRYNDIALFRLSRPAKMTGHVRPACLHTAPDEFAFKKATAAGWGKTDYSANEGSEDLLKVALSFVGQSQCNLSFAVDVGGRSLGRGIVASQLCAGEERGGKDTCQGDSGGPLQVVRGDPYCMYSVLGVTSFGKFCGFKNSPAVYTRVSYFVPWIESVVWK